MDMYSLWLEHWRCLCYSRSNLMTHKQMKAQEQNHYVHSPLYSSPKYVYWAQNVAQFSILPALPSAASGSVRGRMLFAAVSL